VKSTAGQPKAKAKTPATPAKAKPSPAPAAEPAPKALAKAAPQNSPAKAVPAKPVAAKSVPAKTVSAKAPAVENTGGQVRPSQSCAGESRAGETRTGQVASDNPLQPHHASRRSGCGRSADQRCAAPVATATTPARAGRPSSRLAQLTVPSMAQSVASTAAKASYTQSAPRSIAPPMAASIKKDPKLAE